MDLDAPAPPVGEGGTGRHLSIIGCAFEQGRGRLCPDAFPDTTTDGGPLSQPAVLYHQPLSATVRSRRCNLRCT